MIFFKSLLLTGTGLIFFFTASADALNPEELAAKRLAPMLPIVNVPFSEEDLKNPQNRALVISNLSEKKWNRTLQRSPAQKQAIIQKLIEVFLFDPNERVSLAAKRIFLSTVLNGDFRDYNSKGDSYDHDGELYDYDRDRNSFYYMNETVMSALSETNETTRLRAVKLLFSFPHFGRRTAFLQIIEKALSDPDPEIRMETIRRLKSETPNPFLSNRYNRELALYFALQTLLADTALTDPDPKVREAAQKKLNISPPPVLLKLITALEEKQNSDQWQRAVNILLTSEFRLARNIIRDLTFSLIHFPHNIQLAVVQILGKKKALLQEAVYIQIMRHEAYAALSPEEKNTAFKSWKEKLKALDNNRSLQKRLVKIALDTLNPSSRSTIIQAINLNLPIVWKIIDQGLSHPNQEVQAAAVQILKERGHSLPREAWTKFDFMRKLKTASNEGDFPFPQEEENTENISEPASSQRESDPAPSKLYALFSFLQVPITKCKKAVLSKTE